MDVVVEMIACIKFRVLLAAVAVVTAACMVLAPVLGAPGEQIDYRRLVEFESTRTYSDELTVALASRDVRVAGRAALALGRTEDARAAGPLRNATGARDVSLRTFAVYGYGLLAAKTPISTEVVTRMRVCPAGPGSSSTSRSPEPTTPTITRRAAGCPAEYRNSNFSIRPLG